MSKPIKWEGPMNDEYLFNRYLGDTNSGRLVEVGAFNGVNWSHTFGLINKGWSALLFEPHPLHAELCRGQFKGNPKVVVDQCAIGSYSGETELYACGSMSTIKPGMIEVIKQQGYSISKDDYVMVYVRTLDEKLKEHGWKKDFELLVIDVEGAEADVLEGFHIGRYGPHMCIVEACEPCPHPWLDERTRLVKEYFDKARYKVIAADYLDMVFLRGDLYEQN
jgi:FkbM family methyltransferase